MRRRILTWLAALAVMGAAATTGVIVVNATAFGAAGFVRVYLDALVRGDVEGALALPGVDPGDADATLLTAAGHDGLEVTDVTERDAHDGIHEVLARWSAGDRTGTTVFHVERTGTRALFFPEWAFATSPTANLELTVLHDDRARINGVDVSAEGSDARAFAVLVPGVYRIEHVSRYLVADPVTVAAAAPGALAATVDVRASEHLVQRVDAASRARLEGCTTQKVLFPTGCPFGETIPNRVVSAPTWTIASHPEISVTPDGSGGWEVAATPGLAHLVVDVQSIFDGSIETVEEEVPFEVSYALDFGQGDRLTITPTDVG